MSMPHGTGDTDRLGPRRRCTVPSHLSRPGDGNYCPQRVSMQMFFLCVGKTEGRFRYGGCVLRLVNGGLRNRVLGWWRKWFRETGLRFSEVAKNRALSCLCCAVWMPDLFCA